MLRSLLVASLLASSRADTPGNGPSGTAPKGERRRGRFVLQPGLYAGHYTCGNTAWLLLRVERATEKEVHAVFHFVYPASTQQGAFEVHGIYGENSVLKLTPTRWLHKPPGRVVPVGLAGVVSDSGGRFKGEVLHSNCGGFDVNTTQDDLHDEVRHLHLPAFTDSDGRMHAPLAVDFARTTTALSPVGAALGPRAAAQRVQTQRQFNAVSQIVEQTLSFRAKRGDGAKQSTEHASGSTAELERAADARGARGSSSHSDTLGSRESSDARSEEETFTRRLYDREYDQAYKAWIALRRTLSHAESLAVVRRIVSGLLALPDQRLDRAEQQEILSILSTFGGVPQVTSSIARLLRAPDQSIVQHAEAMLRVVRRRSGNAEVDAAMAAGDSIAAGGGVQEALRLYDRAAESLPTWAGVSARKCELFAAEKRHVDCVAACGEALELDEADVISRVQFGQCLKDAKATSSALQVLLQVKEQYPTMPSLKALDEWIVREQQRAEIR
uniref:Uncharacterized protein n=1 Tax=Chrysotila carterae TaxID=13221 RepID=A0A7S4BC79_CHRCT